MTMFQSQESQHGPSTMPQFIISPSENYPQQMENVALLQEVQDDSPPNFVDDTMVAAAAPVAVAAEEATNMVPSPSNSQKRRKENSSWTVHEHKLFLVGLVKYSKGDWKNISRVMRSKTSSQVASHAQKYFNRQKVKNKKRKSIHDIILDESEYIFFSNIIDRNLAPSLPNQNQNQNLGVAFEESHKDLVPQQTFATATIYQDPNNTNIENHGTTMMGSVNPSITNHQSSNFYPQIRGNIYPDHGISQMQPNLLQFSPNLQIATEEPYHHGLFSNHNGHQASAPTTSLNQDLGVEDHNTRMMGGLPVNHSITTNHQSSGFPSQDWSQPPQSQIHQTYHQRLQAESTSFSLPLNNSVQQPVLQRNPPHDSFELNKYNYF